MSDQHFLLDGSTVTIDEALRLILSPISAVRVKIAEEQLERVRRSQEKLMEHLEAGHVVYGVTSGFGDSCQSLLQPHQAEQLQKNLISYLSCGVGAFLSPLVSRATLFARLVSLARGYSGVSPELLERMILFLDQGWSPRIPREGSLGASGDLVPLAHLARALCGDGEVDSSTGVRSVQQLLSDHHLAPYSLRAKEGLALVNGTSTMVGAALVQIAQMRELLALATVSSAWTGLALSGRTDAFGELVNQQAKDFPGQREAAESIAALLTAENYRQDRPVQSERGQNQLEQPLQDRYSLRCAPQILGPIMETLTQFENWVERELNSTSDNPLVSPTGEMASGGNFYGGYLSFGFDFMKIGIGNLLDLVDRQIMSLFDPRSNRGLPTNLVDWSSISVEDRNLHHGLKGLHQTISALTAELLPQATPNSIFSRSSESHNQDKVSLGMSAANQSSDLLEGAFRVLGLGLVCLAQAIEIKGVPLQGKTSLTVFRRIREHVPFCREDQSMSEGISKLVKELQAHATSDAIHRL